MRAATLPTFPIVFHVVSTIFPHLGFIIWRVTHSIYILIVRSRGEFPGNGLGLHPRRDSFYYTPGVVRAAI